jgi:hypothetical protein
MLIMVVRSFMRWLTFLFARMKNTDESKIASYVDWTRYIEQTHRNFLISKNYFELYISGVARWHPGSDERTREVLWEGGNNQGNRNGQIKDENIGFWSGIWNLIETS